MLIHLHLTLLDTPVYILQCFAWYTCNALKGEPCLLHNTLTALLSASSSCVVQLQLNRHHHHHHLKPPFNISTQCVQYHPLESSGGARSRFFSSIIMGSKQAVPEVCLKNMCLKDATDALHLPITSSQTINNSQNSWLIQHVNMNILVLSWMTESTKLFFGASHFGGRIKLTPWHACPKSRPWQV